ncbi:MAG: nucleotide pyrophosphohydrolase [Desulfoarculaceae bacterium]|nr:nucleotide pyrophosphohydrolase [Desulfoarculaceae bacterium]
MPNDEQRFSLLLKTVSTLLGPAGCPWDQKQSTLSLKKYFIEESSEIIAAIDNNDPENLCEELGDMLFLLILMAEINKKAGTFTLNETIRRINEKMIRRHPHVFGDGEKGTEEELEKQWRAIKSQEKGKKRN